MAKIVGRSAYAHIDYLHTLPQWARYIIDEFDEFDVFSLQQPEWNVVKVTRGKEPSISLLSYPYFEHVDHPELAYSYKVWFEDLGSHVDILRSKSTSFSNRKSPPILHRKELLVDTSHPSYERWAALTKDEEEAGLLSRRDIGTKLAWERLLERVGMKVLFGNLVEDNSEYEAD